MASKTSQSEKIRRMAHRGLNNGAIAKKLGIRYQTVWRTLHRPFQGVVPQTALEEEGIRKVEEPLLDAEVEVEVEAS
jgi:predicted DNA-binding protein (UPF0251 family)